MMLFRRVYTLFFASVLVQALALDATFAQTTPTGPSHPCVRGRLEGAPNLENDEGNCYSCKKKQPHSDDGGAPEGDPPPPIDPGVPDGPTSGGGDGGTGSCNAAVTASAGGGGTCDVDSGAFALTINLGVGGGSGDVCGDRPRIFEGYKAKAHKKGDEGGSDPGGSDPPNEPEEDPG